MFSWIMKYKKIYKIFIFFILTPLRLIRYSMRGGIKKKPNTEVHKKIDKVFILASGASVNKINFWGEINENDSIGFNLWLLHWYIPNFYFIEWPRDDDINEKFKEILKRKKEYMEVKIFNTPGVNSDKDFLKKLFNNIEDYKAFVIAAPTIWTYQFALKIFYAVPLFYNNFTVCEGTSSIDRLINYCMSSSYSEIILCGVDLNNIEYFYKDFTTVPTGLEHLIPRSGQEGRVVHKTNDPHVKRFGLTVSDSVLALLSIANKKGISIYISNPESALADLLPVYHPAKLDKKDI